ncbi:hypothetical protein SEPCBS119000_000673 [Sporothrix epigloea]|uniref:Uncharacterized protein n=1 Tax=Sporothrix epigloea TaxID=1892477 RepID=A0ABP0D9B5_9PEZI
MPATDGLQPPLTPGERAVVKSYGGWTNTMHSFGLKAYDLDHIQEAKAIVSTMAAADQASASKGSKSK